MRRLREGWWLMLALCVASGLWFLAMPLMGLGFEWGPFTVRPGWLGLPPCVFGAVYAAHATNFSRISGTLFGAAIFAATLVGGVHVQVQAASNWAPCHVLGWQQSCTSLEHFETAAEHWSVADDLGQLRSPLEPTTFCEAR